MSFLELSSYTANLNLAADADVCFLGDRAVDDERKSVTATDIGSRQAYTNDVQQAFAMREEECMPAAGPPECAHPTA